jgi:precorrin-4 methylase
LQKLAFPRSPLYWTDQRIRSLDLNSKSDAGKAQIGKTSPDATKASVQALQAIEYAPKEKTDLQQQARSGRPLAIHLSLQSLERLLFDLLPFYGVTCPVAVVLHAERGPKKIVRGTLETIGLFQPVVSTANSIYVLVG